MAAILALWRRAPIWRGALVVSACLSALAVFDAIKPQPAPLAGAPAAVVSQPPIISAYQPVPALAPPLAPPPPSAPARQPVVPGLAFGQTFAGTVPFGGRSLPLPPGEWRVVAVFQTPRPDGVIINMAALAHHASGVLNGLITLVGNGLNTPSTTGFRGEGGCERSDLNYVNVVSNDDFGQQDCQTIDFYPVAESDRPGGDNLLRAAFGELRQGSVTLPQTLVGPLFRFADQQSVLILRVLFNPESEGISRSGKSSWADSEWNKYNITRNPAKRRYLEGLITWTRLWTPKLRMAWRETNQGLPTGR